MKKQQFNPIIKSFLAVTCFLSTIPVIAQKENSQFLLTKEQITQINEVVKPVKEQIEGMLNKDATGTYKAYQEEVRKLGALKSYKDRSTLSNQIREKYAAFFQQAWEKAKVDEKLYQQRIKEVLPDASSSAIEFQPFLNFAIVILPSTGVPSTPPPTPEDKFLDVCSIAAGQMQGESTLISGGGGSYGNCFLRTSAWGGAAAGNNLYGSLKNNITIPGTLPDDARKLHVRKRFDVKVEATSFAVLGFGFAEARAMTYQSNTYLFVMSPVIFASSKTITKTIQEDYLLEKKDVAKSVFKTSAGTMAYLINGNWCSAECNSISWSICEEK